MSTNLLNDRQYRVAKPKDKEYLLSDGEGLFLRVRPNGAKDWLFVYTFSGKRRKLGLGSFEVTALATARSEADKARDALAQQIDPQLRKAKNEAQQVAEREALEASKARMTVKELFGRWERLELSGRKDAGKEVKRSFEKDVLPKLGALPAEDVKRSNVAAILDGVVERGSRIVARNLLGDIRQMYGYAIARGLLENDPTSHMKRDDYGKKKERERVLSDAEVKELVKALPTAHMAKSAELAIWVQLSTCCRIGELSKAKWEHVDLDIGTWRIPAETAKNEKEHTVTLSDFALAKFKELHAISGKMKNEDGDEVAGVWVFPARRNDSHVDEKSLSKQVADRQRGDKGALSNRSTHGKALMLSGGKWTPHDLRRTGATLMTKLRVLPEVVERCLNHREQNRVKRIYQRYDYAPEMKQAWQLLGERLELLTRSAGNVVTLRGKAA